MLQGMTAHYLTHSTYPLKTGDKCAGACVGGRCRTSDRADGEDAGRDGLRHRGDRRESRDRERAGADEAIVYTRDDFAAEVKHFTDGKGVDVIYDSVGATTFLKGLDVIRPRGMMALFGQSSGPLSRSIPAF